MNGRRAMLRLLVEQLQVYKTHVDLKLVFLPLIKVSFDSGRQS